MMKVALLSFWHVHAKDYARQASDHPETVITAVWDEVAERGRQQAEALGVPFYEQLHELLAVPELEGVIVDAPTSLHPEVILAAARAGKHIFTEKVIALTSEACDEILVAVEKAGVKLTVSLPRLNMPFTQVIQQMLRDGLLGDVTLIRTRLSHNGALPTEKEPNGWLPAHFFELEPTGGGAMTDLGCHPMVLARLFMGELPDSVSASYGYVTGREVEDNAVAVLRWTNGALAVVEAGFATGTSHFFIEIHGTAGSVTYSKHDDRLQLRSAKLEGEAANRWHDVTEMPAPLPSAFEQWVDHVRSGTTAVENIRLASDLTRLIEASNTSARSGSAVRL
ncbi:Gfo/Idh/MocA family protein [Paenibacillus rigui]|uniref:Oxidoreductase n=1 Tax=Paenibacillus rigui TaxID=554312 RepID=A0A229USH3_9BACL|nr:Gfo/Idh/MocA family oxidoreductase [Paenibacillus rigui]OXM86587.1 oxidoreductase [Paenibacillus rigui]